MMCRAGDPPDRSIQADIQQNRDETIRQTAPKADTPATQNDHPGKKKNHCRESRTQLEPGRHH